MFSHTQKQKVTQGMIFLFFNKQPSCDGSNVKNGLKIKQLAKQPLMLKTLMQKILVLDSE